ncbi:MAG: CarD family transcriptional regulator [Eubacteriales bacterium]|nr:CarD family transcriptional regulator [Eubacteriales bacterium]
MYQVGDTVVYGIHGVCRVVDQEERLVDRKRLTYLALEPVGQDGSKFLVPTQNAAAMAKLRRMLSREELETMLESEEVRADGWIKDENQRKQAYRELINSGDRTKLMCMVRTLYRHKAAQAAAGRKCHICDENFLRDAEKLLTSEISIVLNMESDQVRKYIRERLKEDA